MLTLDDPRLFTYPWIYFVEPGNLQLADSDVAILREFLLRGGTADVRRLSRSVRVGSLRERR